MKKSIKPGTYLWPTPAVFVTCGTMEEDPNIITIAWTGTVASLPPMVGIAIRPSRFSHGLIEKNREFAVNLPTTQMVKDLDYCGVVSGRDVDKFLMTGLTPLPGKVIHAPLIAESPLILECQLQERVSLSSHHLFIGEIVQVQVEHFLLDEKGSVHGQRLQAVSYMGGDYWSLGEVLGKHGFSKR